MEVARRFITGPPSLQTFREVKPTLLISWWSTFYAITIIIIRVAARYVRTEKLFADDGIMLLAIIPLMIRAALVHVVLLFGTNNTDTNGLSSQAIHQRQIGSQLVLVSRIMYAAYLWAIKYSVSMFLRTMTESVWQRSHQRLLRYLHIFLAMTFLATVIADLAACTPFNHYWQVVPDPGPQCRQGAAHLFTMGTLNILTNLFLIIFPIPMIVKSRLTAKTQASIIFQLALPLLSVVLTIYAIPHIVNHRFSQQSRSVIASCDILLAAFIANATVLVSILQDRGYKKTKYKHGLEREGFTVKATLKPELNGMGGRVVKNRVDRWGSDEDLMRSSDVDDLSLRKNGETMVSVEHIKLQDMKREGTLKDKRQKIESRSEDFDKGLPEVPDRAKVREGEYKLREGDIRVATTWDVSVEDQV